MSKSLRVLMVEDSEADAMLLLLELERGGYEPTYQRVDTPEALKAALDGHNWDIILSDYMMPRFSGPAALRLVQEMGIDLPFIVVTGQVGEVTAVETMKAGAHDYILKGNLTRLVPAIQRELGDAAVRRERGQAEDALRKSDERLKIALGAADLGVWELDLANHSAWRSPRHDQIFGYDRMLPEWTYEMFLDHVIPEHRTEVDQKFQKALATGQAWEFECQIRRVDGAIRWIWAQGGIIHQGQGESPRMLGIVRDMTERKRMEVELRETRDELEMRVQERTEELEAINEELRNEIVERTLIEEERKQAEEEREALLKEVEEQRHLFQMVVENAPAGIAVLQGSDLVYDMVNPAYQLFAPGKQMQGKTFAEVWPEAAKEQVPLLRRVLDTGDPFYAANLLIPIRRSPDAPLEDRYWTYSYLRLPPDHTGQAGILSCVTEDTEQINAKKKGVEL